MMKSRSRSRMALAITALVVAGAASYVGCAETRRTLGEDCLKDEDCLSGICSSLKCAAAPPILGSVPPPTGTDGGPGPGADGGSDAQTDATSDAGDAAAD